MDKTITNILLTNTLLSNIINLENSITEKDCTIINLRKEVKRLTALTSGLTKKDKNTKIMPICKICNSPDVTVDASVSWSYGKQDWIDEEIFTDNPFCNKCMKNQEIMWIDSNNTILV